MSSIQARDGSQPRLEPSRCALLCIDMQHDFCHPDGYVGRIDAAAAAAFRGLAPVIRRLQDACRSVGLPVLHTREGHLPDLSDCPPAKLERSRRFGSPIGAAGPLGRFLIVGESGQDIIAEVKPQDGEPVWDKPGYSAFKHTNLQEFLEKNMVDTLILTGVTLETCITSTLREATDLGYRTMIVDDATGALESKHRAACLSMIESEGGIFGWVVTSDALLTSLEQSASTSTSGS